MQQVRVFLRIVHDRVLWSMIHKHTAFLQERRGGRSPPQPRPQSNSPPAVGADRQRRPSDDVAASSSSRSSSSGRGDDAPEKAQKTLDNELEAVFNNVLLNLEDLEQSWA